ncbi:hypothetical protein POTOM_002899 [Populus tomentosa]|uniref:EF-hand domain-containing protein n=1 Tax=Populus tomentosa TaxID=118781 RepID=A0A8X8J021_POPTO|nr:hypothetical protein POTOM_002899 [Populus tomentosa]
MFAGSGVSTDIWTCYAARIMAISVLPFIVVQVLQTLHSTSGRRLAVLIGLILSLAILITYCLYQVTCWIRCLVEFPVAASMKMCSEPKHFLFHIVFQPWIQERKLKYTRHKLVMSGILKHLRFLTDDGSLDTDVVKKSALVIGIRFEEIDFDKDDAVSKLMKDFDTSNDNYIDETEFINGIQKWHNKAMRVGGGSPDPGPRTHKYLDNFHDKTKKEHALLRPQEPEEGQSDEGVKNPRWTSFKASLMLLAGAVIAAAFADPLVDAVDNFSDATSIPTFFISFIALPLATNSSEAVSAIIFASRKKVTTASLTFSELYGAVTMNNVLCLAVFLALVYFRELTWDFSAEVLVICIVCVVMGAFASFRTTFPLWTSFLAFFLYPFSLVLVYVLDYVLGWS